MSDELALIQQMMRDFGAREIAPHAARWDAEARFPAEAVAALADLGMLAIEAPEALGGAELGALGIATVMEELAAFDASLALTLSVHNTLVIGQVMLAGTPEQQAALVPPLATGERLGAWALSEPHAGSDAAALSTRAERRGDDWVLTGEKSFVTSGSVAQDCVVFARTGEGKAGVTAFLVDTASPGWRVLRRLDKHGLRASDTADIALDGVVVPDARRLGAVDGGLRDAMRLLPAARVNLAAIAVGIARGALEAATRYATERVQFDKPISEFQMIQWKIADGATAIDAARLLTHRAAGLRAAGRPFRHEAAMAKLFASEMAPRVCSDAIQVHGGYGYTTDFPVERAWRDARMCTIAEGTSEILRILVARGVIADA